jgi:type II secretory pathway pseudopilin PulG
VTAVRDPRVIARARGGFSLVELLIVILIITLAFGMITLLPQGDKRDADVSAAAEELAGTLRQARTIAMDRRCIAGVSFNIQNAPGTSGKLINNNSGGHWYRIIGPVDAIYSVQQNGSPVYPYLALSYADCSTSFLANVKESWIGDTHFLPRRHVRFLALSDQDNGGIIDAAAGDTFPATYPRPWCGYWDATSRRMMPWGGYDPANNPNSGFYYGGADGTIVGSVSPADRFSSGSYWNNAGQNVTPPPLKIFAANEGRPLINGNWLDYVIRFQPDGTAGEDVMRNRINSLRGADPNPAAGMHSGGHIAPGDFGDMFGPLKSAPAIFQSQSFRTPLTSYAAFTGDWAITLCPDVTADDDHYPSADAACASLMPAYRVMVNRYGLVKVVKVMAFHRGGAVFDTTITNWQNPAQTSVNYQDDVATDAAGNHRGTPVEDFLNPDILANRTWWLK